ncbi:uncharacterized protein cubi_00964 [Cryptosporidium ubiquitum]|uniref:DIX domain-containing protein n=1 Tax=Cryptosporidium ubiquitum TaxID=857276 RepID=A0A1J4MBH2_9CRYT|nr:uncharacterized protein cubi_00964 [Cryptosporidium ubiquitum]OII70819.1 hypothetical protein cubi_00964 [Cryptosporidium ubiquitum]
MTSEAGLTTVYYFIPLDGDREDNPNTFKVQGDYSSLTIKQVKDSFPLPGIYYFRFKVRIGNTYAWMDPLSDDDIVPLYDDAIIAKVLRINWDYNCRLTHRSKNKQDAHSATTRVVSPPSSLSGVFYQQKNQIQHQPPTKTSQPHPPPPPPPPPILRHSMTSDTIPSTSNNVDLIDLNCDYPKWNSSSGYI